MILMELMQLSTDHKVDEEDRHDWQDRRLGARRIRARLRQERRTEELRKKPPRPELC